MAMSQMTLGLIVARTLLGQADEVIE